MCLSWKENNISHFFCNFFINDDECFISIICDSDNGVTNGTAFDFTGILCQPMRTFLDIHKQEAEWICSSNIYVCAMRQHKLNKWPFCDILIIQEENGKCTQRKRKYLLLLRNLKVHGNNGSLKVETGFSF